MEEAARKADEKAAELKAVAAKKAAELQAATAEAIAAGVHPAAPLAAERPVSSGRGATQRKTTLPPSGGDAARADSDEPKVHGGGGAGSLNGFNSGAGGAGGAGFCRVYTW